MPLALALAQSLQLDAATMNHLSRLSPELRAKIYEEVVQYPGGVQRPQLGEGEYVALGVFSK